EAGTRPPDAQRCATEPEARPASEPERSAGDQIRRIEREEEDRGGGLSVRAATVATRDDAGAASAGVRANGAGAAVACLPEGSTATVTSFCSLAGAGRQQPGAR